MNDVVEFYETRESPMWVDHADKFAFRKDLKWHWLQRICICILKKLGCYAQYNDIQVKRIRIDTGNVAKDILKEKRIIERLHFRNPQTLYIGPDTFHQLCNVDVAQSMLSFKVGVMYSRGHEIFGLDVVIVPWMEGFLVTP